MPNSVFDLGGELTVDTTQLKSISEQVETELGKVSEHEARATVSVDDAEAKSKVKSLGGEVQDLGKEIEKKRTLDLDTSQAQAELKGLGKYLTGNLGMTIGGGMLAAGVTGARMIATSAIKSAYAVDLMEKSTEQVFGAAADAYKAEAEKMADATGFLTQQVLAGC